MDTPNPPVPLRPGRRGEGRAPRNTAAVRQEAMRRHNLSVVLRHVLSSPSPLSRADLAATTGLTRATVSSLVDVLTGAGMLAELSPMASSTAGRPAVPLIPRRGSIAAIGLEINVDYVGARALDLSGEVLIDQVERVDLRASSPEQALARAASATQRVVDDLERAGTRIAGIGLALPGLVGRATGSLRLAPNLGWKDVDLNPVLTIPPFAAFHVVLGNEANLAARAEVAARPELHPSFVYVSGEVGVGGALVTDGEVFLGPRGGAGEIGHTTIEPDGPSCTCGARGCLERYAGKDVILAAAGLPEQASMAALVARADAADPRAIEAIERAGWALGIAVASTLNLVAIDRVVLGGIFVPIADRLRTVMTKELESRVLMARWSPVRVEVAVASNYAALTGAALAVLHRVIEDPAAWNMT